MSEHQSGSSKVILFLVILITLTISAGGYILFFHSQKRIVAQDQAYQLLQDKLLQAEDKLSRLQKKYDAEKEELSQEKADHQKTINKLHSIEDKDHALQAKIEELTKENVKLNDDIKKQSTSQTTNGVAKPANEQKQETSPLSAISSQPLTAAPTSQIKTTSVPTTQAENNFQCPASEIITKNVSSGKWNDGYISWWVDSSIRPLYDNETVKNLFQVLFDSSTIACYYHFGKEEENTWLVVKGASKEKKLHIIDQDGWAVCQNHDCEYKCTTDKLSQCHFTFN